MFYIIEECDEVYWIAVITVNRFNGGFKRKRRIDFENSEKEAVDLLNCIKERDRTKDGHRLLQALQDIDTDTDFSFNY